MMGTQARSTKTRLAAMTKNYEPSGHDDRLAEPLLAAHDQAKLDLIAKEDAKIDAGRLAEEERQNCQRQQRELRDLANCVSTATMPGDSFRERKLQKILRFSKKPFRVFRSQKIVHGGYPIAREAKVMNPNARLFSGCRTVPSGPDSVLPSMRNASGTNIQFAIQVDSAISLLERDWWNDKKDEEEFGGALGNNYVNNYTFAGMAGGFDSDSDSDSD